MAVRHVIAHVSWVDNVARQLVPSLTACRGNGSYYERNFGGLLKPDIWPPHLAGREQQAPGASSASSLARAASGNFKAPGGGIHGASRLQHGARIIHARGIPITIECDGCTHVIR